MVRLLHSYITLFTYLVRVMVKSDTKHFNHQKLRRLCIITGLMIMMMHSRAGHDTRRDGGRDNRIQPMQGGNSPAVEGDDEWTAGELLGLLPILLMRAVTPRYRKESVTPAVTSKRKTLIFIVLFQRMTSL